MRDRVVVCNSGISSDTVRPDDPRVISRLGVLCLGVFSERSPCGVRVCDLLLSLLRIKTQIRKPESLAILRSFLNLFNGNPEKKKEV